MRSQRYEFRVFPEGANYKEPFTIEEEWKDDVAAKGRAGRLAKANNGPVDLALGYTPGGIGQDWSDRYLTTARPDEYTAKGFSFERLD